MIVFEFLLEVVWFSRIPIFISYRFARGHPEEAKQNEVTEHIQSWQRYMLKAYKRKISYLRITPDHYTMINMVCK